MLLTLAAVAAVSALTGNGNPLRIHIVLVDKHGWTPLATSKVVVLP